ncbi:hypothetical protein [Nonomuraea endophytica]|uniref:Uncharacterized protein n=1 Tax=Nonomuraea endophytica TaxID=714136 RepID=A0A7W8A7Z1_9ACTN|nr:hypothetical protein [Nonomuraea endophytica]MBB5081292.1 hypothetical protein [Nonomuraea endophytica]
MYLPTVDDIATEIHDGLLQALIATDDSEKLPTPDELVYNGGDIVTVVYPTRRFTITVSQEDA